MNITVFGANGLTGRQLVGQALQAGHDVVAVTRRPAEFPFSHDKLTITEADVHDERAVMRVLESGSEAVLSTLGVPFTRKSIDVYSAGIVISARDEQHGIARVVVVSSPATEPHRHRGRRVPHEPGDATPGDRDDRQDDICRHARMGRT